MGLLACLAAAAQRAGEEEDTRGKGRSGARTALAGTWEERGHARGCGPSRQR